MEHITISLFRVRYYLALPKSSIESNYGLSERGSASNATIIKVFKNVLENRAKAMYTFIPELNLDTDIDVLVNQGKNLLAEFISNL